MRGQLLLKFFCDICDIHRLPGQFRFEKKYFLELVKQKYYIFFSSRLLILFAGMGSEEDVGPQSVNDAKLEVN